MIIFACNALSCYALVLYMLGMIDSRRELQYETVFLFLKGGIEVITGKFSWELLLHHTAMIGGFLFNQHPTMRCWAFITVHQQYVHFPFAVRALWRLTLPAFGYFKTEGWTRRGLVNSFWVQWMWTVGYRTPLIAGYCFFAMVQLKWYWQPLVGLLMAAILGKLDVGRTKAMWPKQAYPDKMHQLYFQIGTRATFAAGFGFAISVILTDVAPEYLPGWALVPFWPWFEKPTLQCLADDGRLAGV